ncbi:hypothetical protein [Sphingomonas sp. NFR15]|uniref:hypothetical protein n=1 Tax=Sphingomonas sp. NFR15 TaxID=1566282 RepID=UPI00088687D9|nr:hypothetical protein [Sphingomonas sp. NFR15]SDA21620.1 hypothetical protein SAMN03159340_01470 [Sphingomonas sp. NFR15]
MPLEMNEPVRVHTADQGIIAAKFVMAWTDWSEDEAKPLIDAMVGENVLYGSIPHVDHAWGRLPSWSPA